MYTALLMLYNYVISMICNIVSRTVCIHLSTRETVTSDRFLLYDIILFLNAPTLQQSNKE